MDKSIHFSWLLVVGIILMVSLSMNAQQRLEIITLDPYPVFGILDYKKKFTDELSAQKELATLQMNLQGKGHLEVSIDSMVQKDSLLRAWMHVGPVYEWATLKNGNIDEGLLEEVRYREKLYTNKPFHYTDLKKLQDGLLEYAEQNGYPFAMVWLDSIQIVNNKVEATLFMNRNKFVEIGDVVNKGDVKLSESYLRNYLGLKKGSAYDKEKILRIRNRIKELPFAQETSFPTINFRGDQANVNLFLKKKKASRFDFVVGVLPNSQETGKLLLTGTFNAEMHNQLGFGERIFAEFKQLRPQTQELDLELAYPYILNVPFGIELDFSLYKRDTTYLELDNDLGVQYLFEGGNYLKFFWNSRSINILNVDEDKIVQTKKLPASLDVSNASFGVEYQLQKLDYRYNPRSGWGLHLRGSAGFRSIKENSAILELEDPLQPDYDFRQLYDSLNLRTVQYRISGGLETYIPIFKRSTIKTSVKAGYIFGPEEVFASEQFRIGGNRLMRGFDEESIFANLFAVSTLEYRFLLGQNAYFFAFADYAYLEDLTALTRVFDHPLGFGAGMSFETAAGIFGISYAMGRQRGNPIDFRAAKIHLGYINLF